MSLKSLLHRSLRRCCRVTSLCSCRASYILSASCTFIIYHMAPGEDIKNGACKCMCPLISYTNAPVTYGGMGNILLNIFSTSGELFRSWLLVWA